jgi:hypothetical protein
MPGAPEKRLAGPAEACAGRTGEGCQVFAAADFLEAHEKRGFSRSGPARWPALALYSSFERGMSAVALSSRMFGREESEAARPWGGVGWEYGRPPPDHPLAAWQPVKPA